MSEMSDAIQRMIRLPWAMSLFAVGQTARLLTAAGTARAPRRAARAFDAVADAAAEQLDGALATTYRDGDRWLRELVGAAFGAVDPALDVSRQVASRTIFRGSLLALRRSAEVLVAALPASAGAGWQELRNKLEAFEHFQFAESILSPAGRRPSGLREQVESAERYGPYLELWLAEGLGFAYAEAAWRSGEPRELLRRPATDALPAGSLIPLHTGMGLSLARRALPEVEAPASDTAVAAALERFDRRCQDNARDGFALASYEALGLIVRQLAPEAVADVDRALAGAGERRRGAFWHGLGRGLYFVASQSLPGSTGRAVDKARREAPAGLPRANALSGLAWAVTLVNLRQPALLEAFLDEQRFVRDEGAAAGAGIASALRLWVDAAGREATCERFLGHRPDAGVAGDWRRLVAEPCERALAGWSELKRKHGPGEIFRYRPEET